MASFGKRQAIVMEGVQPRRSAAPAQEAEHPSEWPLLTIALSLTLAGVFAIQQTLGVEPGHVFSLDLRTALAWGGVDRYLVMQEHEWWRVFTAPWLHGSLDHLVGNLITLGVAGAILERRIGAGWLAAIYLIGSVGGSIGSMALGQPTLISVGASGAIMALVTLVFALSFHAAYEKNARWLRRMALFVLVPAVGPTVAHGGTQIDVGAHFGGFVAGLTLAFGLLVLWKEDRPTAPARSAAAAAAMLCLVAVGLSFAQISAHYPAYAARNALVAPLSAFRDEAAAERDAFALSQRYPRDPGLRLVLALTSFRDRYYQDAEAQARAGLAERELLATEFAPTLEKRLQMMLAVSLLAQHRDDEAHEAARPLCGLSDPGNADIAAVLRRSGLCGA